MRTPAGSAVNPLAFVPSHEGLLLALAFNFAPGPAVDDVEPRQPIVV